MNQEAPDLAPSMELPKPQADLPPTKPEQAGMVSSAEAPAAMAMEQVGSAAPAVPLPLPATTSTASATANADSIAVSGLNISAPAIADDTDLIEKEWVEKAKEIVQHTKDDPYLQNKEMNKMKADYLKKRYNKDIKLSEG